MRAAVPILNPCSQAQPENTRHRARNRDIHLRHFEYATTSCHRDNTEPRRSALPYLRFFPTHLFPYVAICALSPSADSSYLAYPSPVPSPTTPLATSVPPPAASASGATQSGDVLLFSTRSLTVANVIQAHKAPISFLSINSSGSLLATSSEKGTVIRVWSVPGAEKLYQFRRGTREARIYSINFNVVSSLLAVSSAHDTVHIFKLGPQRSSSSAASSSNGSKKAEQPGSPAESVDSRDGSAVLDGGYEAFVEKKKKGTGVSYVSLSCRMKQAT